VPDPIYTSHQGLINLANRECGYKNVYVEQGAQGRWSNKGNLVVEHRNGSEDVCRNGRVISRGQNSQPYRDPVYQNPPRRDYDRDQYQPRPQYQQQRGINATDAAILIIGGALLGAALVDD
jgi:hypothetical protein